MKLSQVTFIIFLLWMTSSGSFSQPITVGIVQDTTGNEFDHLNAQIKSELRALTAGGEGVTFEELSADWQTGKIKENLHRFLQDPEVDIIVTLGFLSSEMAARLSDYSKPVIAATVLDPELQELTHQQTDEQDAPGFSWIESNIRLKNDMHHFADIFDVQHLAVIIPIELYQEFSLLKSYLDNGKNTFDLSFIPVRQDENPVQQIPQGVDAAMVFPLIAHAEHTRKQLFSGLNLQGIPSLAVSGTAYLDQGGTITFTPGFTFQQMARQVALSILKSTEGKKQTKVVRTIDEEARMPVVNMKSMRLTGRFPDWEKLEDAIFLNVAAIPGDELTLHQAIAIALENNLQGKIADQDLLLAEKDIRIARSQMFPKVEVSGTGIQLSENLVETSMGQRGEFTMTGSVSLRQVIYSEAAFANIALQKLAAENTRHSSRQTTLDIVLEVSVTYISLLFAKNNLIIQNENLHATHQNLELAKARVRAGEGSISDVNRWTSELNMGKMDLNEAEAGYKAAMYQLNELLNQPVSNKIPTPENENIANTIIHNQQILDAYFSNPELTEKYADFIIDEMLAYSPELQQLTTAGEIIDRQLSMRIRQLYMPEVALTGAADQVFMREGVIRDPQLPVPDPPDDITWSLGLRISIPIFEGGRRRTEVQRATIEQDKINWQKEDMLNKLESGIRSNVQFLQASFRELRLSENAAQAAEDNFRIVRDAYAQGMVNAAELADAQSVMTRTRQIALGSNYQYILDYIHIERLQGSFSFLTNDSEKTGYTNRLLNYLNKEQ